MYQPVSIRGHLLAALLAVAALVAGCAGPAPGAMAGAEDAAGTPDRHPDTPVQASAEEPAAALAGPDALAVSRSISPPGATPAGWETWTIRPDKTPTRYRLARQPVKGRDRVVLHAVAESAASALGVPVKVLPGDAPFIRWSWRADALVPDADGTRPETEDAPARIVLAFDGDRRKLSMREQMMAQTARMLLGREPPYATIIYTWDTHQPVESIMNNAYSSRIKKKVVESGPAHLGRWMTYERNYVQDYIEAFGEPPGELIGVGVMTDSDNTHSFAESWYGDIQLLTPGKTALGSMARLAVE